MSGADGHIRTATRDDVQAMSNLITRTVKASNAVDYSAEVVDHLLAEFAPEKVEQRMEGREVFVLCAGDDIVGTISLGLAAGKLHSMFVAPEHQRSGIGRLLVAHLEQRAASIGFQEIVVSSSLTARSFYEKVGFTNIVLEEKPGAATWFMKKRLSDA